MDEISARLREIVAEDGPRAVAVYVGTQGLTPTLGDPLARSFIAALESPCLFSTMTIDQSAKWIAPARMGTFGGGPQSFEDADVWLLCGTNPLVSVQATLPFELAGLFFHDAEAGVKLLTGGADFTNMEALQDFLVRNARQLGTAGKILFDWS